MMEFTSYIHTITHEEIQEIESMGFSFPGSLIDPELFVNNYFLNFDLLASLKAINEILCPVTKEIIHRNIVLQDGITPKIEIQFFSDDYTDENTGLALVRTFKLEEDGIIVDHEIFRLPRIFRRKGISKKVLRILFQQYINIGVKKILVFAALEDGGYVWARQFFRALDVKEVDKILKSAKSVLSTGQFELVKLIYDNYYTKNIDGQSFPMYKWADLPFMEPILKQSKWHGSVNLTNPTEFSNFIYYAFR